MRRHKTTSTAIGTFSRLIGLATLCTATLLLPERVAIGQTIDGTSGIANGTIASAPQNPDAATVLATVDPSTGALTTSFPFELPDGRGDAQPHLALTYNSSSSLGTAGVGWTLSLPQITRKGTAGVPNFVDVVLEDPSTLNNSLLADTYYVDGKLLVAICRIAGERQCQYGTPASGEVMPSTLFGTSMVGWTYFKVDVDDGARYFLSPNGQTWIQQLKSGIVREFGLPLDGAFSDGAERPPLFTMANVGTPLTNNLDKWGYLPVSRWNLVREADTIGNTVYYSWTNNWSIFGLPTDTDEPTQLYLQDVYDTGVGGGTLTHNGGPSSFAHHAHLTWVPNYSTTIAAPGAAPLLPNAVWRSVPIAMLSVVDVTGATWTSTQRQLVREYNISYTQNAPWLTRNYLQTITLTGQCATPVLENPDGSLAQSPASCGAPSRVLRQYGYAPDVPGTVTRETFSPEMHVYPSQANPVWGPWQLVNAGNTDILGPPVATALLDLNQDGRADLVYGPLNQADFPPNPNNPSDTGFLWGVLSPLPTDPNSGCAPWIPQPCSSPFPFPMQIPQPPPPVTKLNATIFDVAPFASNLVYGDLAGDGSLDWLWMEPMPNSWEYEEYGNGLSYEGGGFLPNYFPRQADPTQQENWTPSNAWDADGDGRTDMAFVPDPGSSAFQWTSLTQVGRQGEVYPFRFMVGPQYVTAAMNPSTYSSDSLTSIADMNGDGLADMVILYKNGGGLLHLHVFQNNGDGTYGDLGNGAEIVADSPGSDTLANQSIVRMGDLNGDNVADLAIMNSSGIHICLRSGGWQGAYGNYACQTITYDQLGWPSVGACQPFGSNWTFVTGSVMQIADVDGTGIPRVVVFQSCLLTRPASGQPFFSQAFGSFGAIPTGTVRPGLMTSISAIGGAQTQVQYVAATDPNFPTPSGNGGLHRSNRTNNFSPVPAWAVTSLTTTNQLGRSVAASYAYDQPVYDPRERSFVGFQEVQESTQGASGAPGLARTTQYLTTACVGTGCINQPDYSYYHALRTVPSTIQESDSSSGAPARTTVLSYAFYENYHPMDLGQVRLLWQQRQDVYGWDGTGATDTTVCSIGGDNTQLECVHANLPTAGVDLRKASVPDAFANELAAIDWGQFGKDTPITTTRTWTRGEGDETGWNYRPHVVQTFYGDPTGLKPAPGTAVRQYQYEYDSNGLLRSVIGSLNGQRALQRSPMGAPTPSDAVGPSGSPIGVQLQSITYDQYGNVSEIDEPNKRCSKFTADPLFGQLTAQTTSFAGACGSGGLTTSFVYDRGLGVVTQVTSPGNQNATGPTDAPRITTSAYDAFGRITDIFQPSADGPQVTDSTPAVHINYVQDTGPVRITDVQTADGPDGGAFQVDHYHFYDGFDAILASIDGAGEAPGGLEWIIRGARVLYPNDRIACAQKDNYWSTTNPTTWTPYQSCKELVSAGTPSSTFTYDALGRTQTATDFNGGLTQYTYSAAQLSTKTQDPEQTGTPTNAQYGNATGGHTNAYFVSYTDGHGRTTKTVNHYANGPQKQAGDFIESFAYQATGELLSVTASQGTTLLYSRSISYDTLGHMVLNSEPNTNNNGAGAWIYAYNLNGELVGTSDARGCGENLIHDGLGRVVAEDYSPCTASQPKYTPYNPATGAGAEATNVFDPYSGLATDTYDRAQHLTFGYDYRGRVNQLVRQLAPPGGAASLTNYVSHEYSRTLSWSEANRLVGASTGADVPDLLGSDHGSNYSLDYWVQGVPKSVGGSYGFIWGQDVDATGNPTFRVLGDVASTQIALTLDNNERLIGYNAARASAGPWASYAANPPGSPLPLTFPQTLSALTVSRDAIGDPLTLKDTAPGSAWPQGAQPPSLSYTFSDDYRLTGSTSTYSGGTDSFVPPYTSAETAFGTGAFPEVQPVRGGNRVSNQTFSYDWLGNTQQTTDDANVFLDRSLGTITNGGNSFGISHGPNQLALASGTEGAEPFFLKHQEVAAAYDGAGNLEAWALYVPEFSIRRGFVPLLSAEYQYTWDEVGRLMTAARYDAAQDEIVLMTYQYTAGGQRISTQIQNCQSCGLAGAEQAPSVFRIDVFPSLRLENTQYLTEVNGQPTTPDYVDSAATAHVYLPGAQVFYDTSGELPQAQGAGALHTFLNIEDALSSTAFVVDAATGELVERATYQPYGFVESDYRPTRWQSYRAPIRYTGHEDDAEVGLIYFGARYYAPQLTRWISPDPLTIHGALGDLNPYAFVGGAPVSGRDPFGFSDDDPEDGYWLFPDDNQDLAQVEVNGAPTTPPLLPYKSEISGPDANGIVTITCYYPPRKSCVQKGTCTVNDLIFWKQLPNDPSLLPVSNVVPATQYHRAVPRDTRALTDKTSIDAVENHFDYFLGYDPDSPELNDIPTPGERQARNEQALETLITMAIPFLGPEEAVAYRAIGSTGKVGEARLADLGGKPQAYFKTSMGGRYVDRLAEGVAHESKVGYTTLTSNIQRQIAKDAELMATGKVDEVVWHFFQSPVTGLVGPSGPLEEALDAAGISWVVH